MVSGATGPTIGAYIPGGRYSIVIHASLLVANVVQTNYTRYTVVAWQWHGGGVVESGNVLVGILPYRVLFFRFSWIRFAPLFPLFWHAPRHVIVYEYG